MKLALPRFLAFLSIFFAGVARADKPFDFVHDVAPLIKSRCAECHTSGTYKGSLSLDTREAMLKSDTVVPGKPADSDLFDRITSTDPDVQMPPKGKRLTPAEVALVRTWIEQGRPWPEEFTFQQETYVPPLKPRRPELPPPQPGLEHPIDRIVAVYFRDHQVATPEPLDDVAFIRRVYLDLVGLLPPVDELNAFVADKDLAKHNDLVDRLLADQEAYTGHWLSFWNDLLRNDYKGTGYTDGGRKQITAWLYQAIWDNQPYDQFVRALIAPKPEAEGFVYGIQWRGRVNASQTREIQFSQNISQVFFGINMKCASCHDSFIDRWKLDDAYALAAIVATEPLEIYRCDKATGKHATARFLWPELGSIDSKLPKPERLRQLSELVTHPENGRFQRTIANRIWQRLMGRGIVHPVDVMANRPWSEDLLDYLATYLTDHNYDLKELMRHIIDSRTYQSQHAVIDEPPIGEEYVFRGPEVKRMTAEQFIDGIWSITQTAPDKILAPLAGMTAEKKPKPKPVPKGITVRASLVHSDLLMRSLGRPNREQVVTTRPDLLTTLQALDLSNGAVMSDTLERGAANVLKAHPQADGKQLVEEIYLAALSRKPSALESTTAVELVSDKPTPQSVADLLWAVFVLPEFQLVR